MENGGSAQKPALNKTECSSVVVPHSVIVGLHFLPLCIFSHCR